jgi:hypothetical protein
VTATSSAPGEPGRTLRLAAEVVGKAVQVWDGFWIVATRHRPGLSKHMFEINNRCMVFRLNDTKTGKPVLLVVNAVDPVAIPEVRRIERETGLLVSAIASPGGGHHLHVEAWQKEFTEAKILLPPVRIPRTAHGKTLLEMPRVALMDLRDPLPAFKGQLDAVLFHGLYGSADRRSAGEGAPDTKLGFFRGMLHVMTSVKDPVDELWLHHVASGTVIGGENLGWIYPTALLRRQPFMMRKMIQPDRLWLQTMARKVADPQVVAACWRRILAWPARTVMTFHDPPGVVFAVDARAALAEAVRAAGQLRD